MWQQALGAVGSSLLSGLTGKLFGSGGTSVAKQVTAQKQIMNWQHHLATEFDSAAIQRRVKDAEAAGVSPIAALGMTPGSGPSYSTGSTDFQAANGDNSMGQNIGRSIAAAADPMTRLNMRLLNSQIDGQDLDNQYKAAQIARMTAQVGPSLPGVTDDGNVDGPSKDWAKYSLSDGSQFLGPSGDLLQMIENSPAHGAAVVGRDVLHRIGKLGSSIGRFARSVHDYSERRRARAWRESPYGR